MSKTTRLPGLIDIHVHLRDPGETNKEDFYTGTCAALAGGVTGVFDMPNNIRPVFNEAVLKEKEDIAMKKVVCDYGLFFGTDGLNTGVFEKVVDRVAGLKLYLSLTTGKYVVGDREKIDLIFRKWPKNKVIVVHAENERIDQAIETAARFGNKIHITHVNTKKALESIIMAKKNKINISCDVTPHHLFLNDTHLETLKSFGKVKPPLKSKSDQEFLWDKLDQVDCIASDHAPHSIEEKGWENPPAGVPGLETTLPLLFTAVKDGRITTERIIELTNTNPQKIFGFIQDKSSFVELDTDTKYIIRNEDLKTKCQWSPFSGWEVTGKVRTVFMRGQKVFENGQILVKPGFGKNMIS